MVYIPKISKFLFGVYWGYFFCQFTITVNGGGGYYNYLPNLNSEISDAKL